MANRVILRPCSDIRRLRVVRTQPGKVRWERGESCGVQVPMRFRQHHPCWFTLLWGLLVLSSLPRFGCVCADGTQLGFCPKVMRNLVQQVGEVFRAAPAHDVCRCCCERSAAGGEQPAASSIPQRGCSGSSEPCECRLTLEGPESTTLNRSTLANSLHPVRCCAAENVRGSMLRSERAVFPLLPDRPPTHFALATIRWNV